MQIKAYFQSNELISLYRDSVKVCYVLFPLATDAALHDLASFPWHSNPPNTQSHEQDHSLDRTEMKTQTKKLFLPLTESSSEVKHVLYF